MGSEYDVFLSHKGDDKAEVELLGARLKGEAGLRPFLDKWHLVPGESWQPELEHAVDCSASAAIFFGPHGTGPWHTEEIQILLDKAARTRDDFRVIPVLLPGASADTVSVFLKQRTWVDFRSGLDNQSAFQRLVAGIKGEVVEPDGYQLPDEPAPRTHWSSRLMAKEAGISEHSVLRIWRAFGLKPHRVDSFKLSADPMFVEKVRDIVGLYLNPPDKAIVLCVDEKSQTQALERSQPILPLRPGLPERQTHDYVRHGTLSLFAAYDAATGRVLGRCHQRHRHQEFLAFLERIDAAFPDDGQSQLHLIIDNYSTHKTPKVHRWLLRHPRFHLHFTPTGSSWLNMVERFFARITTEAIRRGSFSSVRQLQAAIDAYLAEHNKEPKPFTWTASADSIFRKLENSLS